MQLESSCQDKKNLYSVDISECKGRFTLAAVTYELVLTARNVVSHYSDGCLMA